MKNNKIGELRLIPAGTEVWSISLQERVKFNRDVVVKITNTVAFDDDFVFGMIQLTLFLAGPFPGIMDKVNGDIDFSYKDTLPYELPKPMVSPFEVY